MFFRGKERHKRKASVQQAADGADGLSHRKCRKNCADSKPFQMTEKDKGHAGSDGQADDIKGNLDFRIGNTRNLSKLSREKVRRNDRELTAVGQSDSKTDQNVAD